MDHPSFDGGEFVMLTQDDIDALKWGLENG